MNLYCWVRYILEEVGHLHTVDPGSALPEHLQECISTELEIDPAVLPGMPHQPQF